MKSAIAILALGASAFAIPAANLYLNGFAAEPAAIEARLIGYCDGRTMAGVEESSFPAGCDWIEPIRYIEDGSPAWLANNSRSAVLGN